MEDDLLALLTSISLFVFNLSLKSYLKKHLLTKKPEGEV